MNLLFPSAYKVFLNIQNKFEQYHPHHLCSVNIKNYIDLSFVIKLKFLNFGSNFETKYFFLSVELAFQC